MQHYPRDDYFSMTACPEASYYIQFSNASIFLIPKKKIIFSLLLHLMLWHISTFHVLSVLFFFSLEVKTIKMIILQRKTTNHTSLHTEVPAIADTALPLSADTGDFFQTDK